MTTWDWLPLGFENGASASAGGHWAVVAVLVAAAIASAELRRRKFPNAMWARRLMEITAVAAFIALVWPWMPFEYKHDRLVMRKLITTAWLPLGSTGHDLTPFLVMAGLSVVSALLMRWKFPHRQWARRLVQTVSAVAFIAGVHPCACMTRDLILGANALGRDDVQAFKYLIVFATVIASTMLAGRIFCGWLCPLGFIQELLAKLSDWSRDVERQGAVLTVRYLMGVAFLGILFYSSYKTKPATFSFIDHAMVFFTMALSLIILTVLTDPKKDAFFKNRFRYWGLATALGVYIYGVYANGPFCVFFTAYIDWASLISCTG
ncbi:4Fe-4S binding protein, partial [bacterium]|nr:4Fe-4S binding protein [bacterium]